MQLSLALAEAGAHVVMVARNLQRLQEAQATVASTHGTARVTAIPCDLCDPTSAGELADKLRQQAGNVSLVINAVGQSDRGTIAGLELERMIDLVRINVGSSLHAVKFLAPLLTEERGVLVLIGSLSSHLAPRYLGGYSIAKHALAALAQQARLETADTGVHITLVSPGPIARPDSGRRYDHVSQAAEIPESARRGGGGAKIKGLEPRLLAVSILDAAARRKLTVVLPRKARLLMIATALSPRLGDFLLRKFSS